MRIRLFARFFALAVLVACVLYVGAGLVVALALLFLGGGQGEVIAFFAVGLVLAIMLLFAIAHLKG